MVLAILPDYCCVRWASGLIACSSLTAAAGEDGGSLGLLERKCDTENTKSTARGSFADTCLAADIAFTYSTAAENG